MKAISLFSGMEAASEATTQMGLPWEFLAYSEIEPAACWVLHARHNCGRPRSMPHPDDTDSPKERNTRMKNIKNVSGIPEWSGNGVCNLGDVGQVDWSEFTGKVDILVGGPPCFPENTPIVSKRGLIPINEICYGDEVWTHKSRWRKVVNIQCKYSKTIILRGNGHWGLETTIEHPFWSLREHTEKPSWTKAKDMVGLNWASPVDITSKTVDDIHDVNKINSDIPHRIENIFDNIPHMKNIPNFMEIIGSWLKQYHDNFRKPDINRVGFHLNINPHSSIYEFIIDNQIKSDKILDLILQLSCEDNSIIEWFLQNLAHPKIFPLWILDMTEDMRQDFYNGYMFSDTPSVNIQGVNISWAVGIKLLAHSLGQNVHIGHNISTDIFSIHQSDINFINNGMIWNKVDGIEYLNIEKPVFNFEVEEDNSYVASGIVVHNCQAFSISGLRGSLQDRRGNLSLEYARAIHELKTEWSFTENVPGWLTTPDNAFGCFLGVLVGADTPLLPSKPRRWGSAGMVDGPHGRAAWRVLDAQGFLPQRRKRIFVVGARADSGGNPAQVLFETETEGREHLGERWGIGPIFPNR